MKQTALSAAVLHLPSQAAAEAAGIADAEPVPLNWLEGKTPATFCGTTWGVPWKRGVYRPGTSFSLQAGTGDTYLPLQTWPLAYWPDGSLKWTAHAITGGYETSSSTPSYGNLRLIPGRKPVLTPVPVTVRETRNDIDVNTGMIQCRIAQRGAVLISSITRGGKIIARDVRLICLRRDQPEISEESVGVRQERFSGVTTSAIIEQNGPVRAVVRIEGKHQVKANEGRAWLPFTIRLYFYAGSDSVRMMHTFIFDGDENKDFISGLGVRFNVPLTDPLQNRHVRFAGENDGVWGEAVRTLTGLRRDPGPAVRASQTAGRATPPADQLPTAVGSRLGLIPAWGDFSLAQLTADGFQIRKRTKSGHGWIPAGSGQRAAGLGYVGGATGGGVAFGLRDFYKRHPTQLDIRNAASDKGAEVTLWLWSPDAPPMDLRFYHDGMGMNTHPQEREGLEITYEDYEKGWGTPQGVARTNELFLWALASTPPREQIASLATALQTPPQLTCRPKHLHAAGVFSNWSLPERRTESQKAIEDQLDYLLNLYKGQIEQRRWYGFWDHGDVMHSYDRDRHEWSYDVGGFAWANSELSPDLWLWYSYLRSGRADVFRMAEAMTRHTSEVDVYHSGRFRGFGSRHNVQHWGDSSKQPRVSTAAYRRIYYYLTADERTGDLMREPLDSDQRLRFVDIGRKLRPENSPPLQQTFVGFGTDWCSLAAAWLTEWERTGDTKWRDRIVNGMRSIGNLPKGWLTGGSVYDLDSGKFLGPGDTISISHLNAVFGAVEINAELLSLLDVPEYQKTWLMYCRVYNASSTEQEKLLGTKLKKLNLGEAHSRLTAYAAASTNDPALAERAWGEFFRGAAGIGVRKNLIVQRIVGLDVLNPVDEGFVMSTNASSQWGLAAIENLALIGKYLPDSLPAETGSAQEGPEST
ncbi:MAG: Tat pathway signal sequence domain protein [Armatimonadota bacterium]